jgi:FkbM family methyltransferase
MGRLRFYFDHSLAGYFFRRARKKWFSPPPLPSPAQMDYHGVKVQLDCLPAGMQLVLLAGNYELPEIKLLPGLISAEDRVLEIGAAIGFLGLYCRKVIQVKHLVSVEPNPDTQAYLKRNYELNNLSPNLISAAMTPGNGPITLHVTEMFWCDSLVTRQDTVAPRQITVDGLTFEQIVQRAGMPFNALILDIEGGEQHLPVKSLPPQVNKVLIELHPDVIGIRPAYAILEQLIEAGFKIHGQFHNTWALRRD